MAKHQYEVQVIKDPVNLKPWTAAQFASFVGTGNVLHDVLFPPASPPTPAQLDLATARHTAAFEEGSERNVFVQIVDPANGAIMGGAKWQFWPHDPKRPLTFPVDYVDDSTPEGKAERTFAQKVMDEFMGRRARDMAMSHGLLDLCFTVPEYERKGVASALVSWGLERTDREGWVAFTEASARGWPVYERLGFERKEVVRLRYDELGDYAQGMGDVVWTYMVRPARRKE
jgi:GNAT superfamily N-acetyltransferase